ncbi:hypothetical protein [Methylorubrum zatmanii]|uniref:Uncharacterized protein n=1 Tax=Methylorubrum zatmanii TaxID=29429 RepID=A0ABW1WSD1_9HYPH|nr:hypothetical protein [Methylorubrum zatmanii]MBD8906187.1 hypothetical protein [Methylorubrum zatmanii]
MNRPRLNSVQAKIERTSQLASEIRAIVERTKMMIATSRAILSDQAPRPDAFAGSVARSFKTTPPDALCAAFDALLEAAQQAEKADDPELFALVEQALLHAGDKVEQAAVILSRREMPVQ